MRTLSFFTGDSSRRRAFTLVELLAAMAIFTVMLGMVFAMLAGAQRAWSAVDRNTRIYENARILMDLITRDLQCAIASDAEGQEIPFRLFDHAYDTNMELSTDPEVVAFVSAIDPGSSAAARVSELQYSHDTSGDYAYMFRRSITSDNHSEWDFYNFKGPDPTDPSDDIDWLDHQNFQRVVEGVESVQISCFDDNDEMTNYSDSYAHLPTVVRVSFTLFDPSALDVPAGDRRDQLINQSRRSFNKIIFLRAE